MHDGLIEVTVSRTWQLATGYCAVELRAKRNAALPPFDEGAMLDVVLDASANRSRVQPLHRKASRRETYVVGVRTQSGPGVEARPIDDTIFRPGSDLLVRPPENLPLEIDERARYILFAGGLGVATIAGIARRLADANKSFELHHFAQSADRTLFREELQALAPVGKIHHHVGLSVDQIAQTVSHALSPSSANAQIYCSGPPRLMDLIQLAARDWVYPRNVHKIYLGERKAPEPVPQT
ncbi:hypothetical protein [Caballeronia ptereochthonis]|uniref:Ferredoxin n=1 Tax=Caballeronia ptereochthonis TaxID=1777144 RepID=A0A158D9H2_9BURK|nr:hypothetical protein [Caballeronia ptereochthonis]SAK91020.1 ferredoxin [Caballeronia ptereochthonis]